MKYVQTLFKNRAHDPKKQSTKLKEPEHTVPGNRALRVSSSAKMHPAAHMSTAVV